MKMIVPKTITYDDFTINLNDSAEDEYDYTGVTTYSADSIVKVSFASDGTTRILPETLYKALAESTDEYPPDSDNWLTQGAVNRHKIYDQYINTQCVADGTESTSPGQIVFTIDSSRCNGIALFGVEGTSVQFDLKDFGGTIVQTFTNTDLEAGWILGWYDYFYKEFPEYHDIIYYFRTYVASTLTVTITDTRALLYPKCGFCVIGSTVNCGTSLYGAEPGFMDFSKITRDSFGNVYSSQGNFAKLANIPVKINRDEFDSVQNAAINVRGVPTVFDGNENGTDFGSLRVLGLLMDFRPTMESYNNIQCTFKIEGIV